jgi:hypothetical protein
LRLAADRLSLQAAQALAFVFSPRNQNELLHQADANQGFQPCSVVQPDLKAFFLIIVDSRGWIVAIAGIDSLPGLGVSCS